MKKWKETSVPYRLKQALERLNKEELTLIRQKLHIKNISALRRKKLTEALERMIPQRIRRVFEVFDLEQYMLAEEICRHGGYVFVKNVEDCKVRHLKECGVIFPGLKDGKKILYMPLEILKVFREINTPDYRKMVADNTELVRLAHGLLYYYGVLSLNQLLELSKKYTTQPPDVCRYIILLFAAASYYGQINCGIYGFSHVRVDDAEKIMREQKARPQVEYYPFTKEQLIKAGEPGYYDQTPALEDFMRFLDDNYSIPPEEKGKIARECTERIQADGSPGDLLQYLQGRFECSSFEMAEQLTVKMTGLFNSTRRWVLRGHTPDELNAGQFSLQPPPSAPYPAGEQG